MALIDGWTAAIAWLERFGWVNVHARIREGQAAAVAALAAIPGVRVLTPPGPQAGLVTFAIDGHDPVADAARMVEEGVIVRWLEHPRALRASIGFHWCHTDIDRLAAAVRAVSGC
jgi:selenocysteine lyase/cysteine desulfurase